MRHYPLEEILQWDVSNWSNALLFWESHIGSQTFDKALELGAREGGISLWLSNFSKEVVCSDYANAREQAFPLHDKHGLRNIRYENIDALQIPYENEFDLIVFKSIIGGIARGDHKDRQQEVFHQIHRALKPGGTLLFAENLTASPLHRFFRKRFTNWSDYWRYVDMHELREFTKDFSEVQLKATGFAGTFGHGERQKRMLARTDRLFFNKLTPQSWKYIAYGTARK